MILCNDHWLLINKLISVSILSSSAMVIIQVNVMSCTGTLRSQSTTVHSRVPVMCGATASHCGRCIHWVTNRTMKWLAARCDLSFLCLRRTTLTGRGLVFSTCLSVCPSVRSSVTTLVNTIFWKRMNLFLILVNGQGHETINLVVRRSKVKVTRGWRTVDLKAWSMPDSSPVHVF